VIRVRVKYLSELFQSITKCSEEELLLEEPVTLRELLLKITQLHRELHNWLINEKGEIRENILILVNNELAPNSEKTLQDNDVVLLTIPFNGG